MLIGRVNPSTSNTKTIHANMNISDNSATMKLPAINSANGLRPFIVYPFPHFVQFKLHFFDVKQHIAVGAMILAVLGPFVGPKQVLERTANNTNINSPMR